ncbi:sensor histidine kinase [Streptosporangium carneum]|uniref:sensor histidine kinase n=1 Tax=Streptosporangium carneum TaxID=47481 RepID=UPI0022F2AF40|nr:sensor histidine kinase [Streptosporangium carneum]
MSGLLRSVWNEPRPPDPPSRVWRDWVLVGVLVPVAILEGVLRPDLPWRAVSVIVTVGLTPTLLWRRTRPLPMVAIVCGVTSLAPLLTDGVPLETYTMVYLLVVFYALFRWGSGREVAIGLTLMIVMVSLSLLFGRLTPGDMVGAFAVTSSAVALGGAFRYRAGARTRELEQIKLLERERLARDLHDTVAHHVSAMAIRAQAGIATSASRPDAATEALHVIEAEAARALDEMRAMVRLLRRDESAELEPGRRIADLEQLTGRGRSGPSVDVEISGDLGDLPPSVEAAIYRIAQESVTNARRHARHATRVEVRVTADDTSVRLRVSDDGDSGLIRPAASPGYGLIGMIERADLLGGTCEAGPDSDRGWTVTAVLPRTGAAT